MNATQVDWSELNTFLLVARHGTLTAAADVLGVPKSTVSRRVQRLESQLRVSLLVRTANQIALTDQGRMLYAHGGPILDQIDSAMNALEELQAEPSGRLRITMPDDMSPTVSRLLFAFQDAYPKVDIEVFGTARFVNLVLEGYDVALRPHPGEAPGDQALRMRSLGRIAGALAASRGWIEEHGLPSHPREVTEHIHVTHVAAKSIRFVHPEHGEVTIAPPSRFVTNSMRQVLHAVRDGRGVGLVPNLQELQDEPGLVPLLTDWRLPAAAIALVWPDAHIVPPRVRAFIDFMVEKSADLGFR